MFFFLTYCSLNLEEVTDIFRHTIESTNHDADLKIDDQLQPIPPELHGAITRTSPELLKHYEHLGEYFRLLTPSVC